MVSFQQASVSSTSTKEFWMATKSTRLKSRLQPHLLCSTIVESVFRVIFFLEAGCPFVNFSGVQLQLPVALMRGEVLSDTVTGRDPLRGEIKLLKAKCPHCHTISDYPGIYWGATGVAFTGGRTYRIGCRNCNQRMDLS